MAVSPIETWTIGDEPPDSVHAPWVTEAVHETEPYLRDFLASRHPARPGPVCPYMPAAVRHRQLLYAASDPHGREAVEAKRIVSLARELSIGRPFEGRFRYAAVVVLYPPETTQEWIDEVQYRSKVGCVEAGIMVGSLHPHNNAESIHGGGFYPLRTPVPSIVLRNMVPSDLRFLDQRRFSARRRLVFLQRYVDTFAASTLVWEREELAAAEELLGACREQVRRERDRLLKSAVALAGAGIIISLFADRRWSELRTSRWAPLHQAGRRGA